MVDLTKMEESLAVMKLALEEIEGRAGQVHADFYRAHYEGCVRLCDLGRQYKTCLDSEQKEILKKEMEGLLDSLQQSLPMLRIHNNN
jgi:hypothetical protein